MLEMINVNNYKIFIYFLNALKSIDSLKQKIVTMHHGVNIINKNKIWQQKHRG